jgi:hypothetical protein
MKRNGGVVKGSGGVVLVGFVFLFCVGIANATITFEVSGIIITDPDGKAYETPVSLRADLTISADTLTVVLTNQSPVDSPYPDTLFSSFFFDILNDSDERPTLSYDDARGDVYQGTKDEVDQLIEANADLRALVDNDDTWQFRGDLNPLFDPGLAFGIGTVGNNGLTDQNGDGNATQDDNNNFNGKIVNGLDFAIYTGDIETQSLNKDWHLVKDSATFTFGGLTGFTEADIVVTAVFGLGTMPDAIWETTAIEPIPEPATLFLLGLGSMFVLKKRRH